MTIMLKDAPGGPELINRLRDEAANLALFFLNEPEEKMLSALEQTRSNLEAEIATILGADVAAVIAQAFVATVAGHRREIKAAAATQRVLN